VRPVVLPPVIGHRGAAGLAPENTLAAFRAAADAGASWVEFDVRLAADGEPVVIHDARLDRTTSGRGAVRRWSSAAIAPLDAGAWFAPVFAGEVVPTLATALAEAARLGLGVNVELKTTRGRAPELVDAVLPALRSWHRHERGLLVSSFDRRALEACRVRAPELPCGLLVGRLPMRWRNLVRRLGCRSVNVGHDGLRPTGVAAIREAGLAVAVYTVDDPRRAKEMWSWGVDAIITDRPDLIHVEEGATRA